MRKQIRIGSRLVFANLTGVIHGYYFWIGGNNPGTLEQSRGWSARAAQWPNRTQRGGIFVRENATAQAVA